MPRLLPNSFIPEKNKLASASATILLAEVSSPLFTTVRIARNTENFTSKGNPYQALWFEIDAVKESSTGDVPTITLRVNNAARAFEAILEACDGAVDAAVKIMAVNSAHPDDTMLEMDFEIMDSSSDDDWAYFSLGAPSLLRKSFPPDRYVADYCSWIPGGAECASAAAAGTCDRTYAACKNIFNNVRRYGGFLGLSNPSVSVV